MMEPKYYKVPGDGVQIQVADWPAKTEGGPTIMAVHGLTANCRSFDAMARALDGAYRLIAVDLRGRGLSDKPASGYSIGQHCADLEQLLNNLGLDKAVFMGHSLGAYISLNFAATRPERTAGAIFIDGGAVLTPEQWGKIGVAIGPSVERLGQVFPSFEAYVETIQKAPYMKPWTEDMENYFRYECEDVAGGVRSRTSPDHIAEERGNIAVFDPASAYPSVTCPALALKAVEGMLADDDHVLPDWAVKDFQAALPQLEVVPLEGANHFSMVFKPLPARDKAVADFLAGL